MYWKYDFLFDLPKTSSLHFNCRRRIEYNSSINESTFYTLWQASMHAVCLFIHHEFFIGKQSKTIFTVQLAHKKKFTKRFFLRGSSDSNPIRIWSLNQGIYETDRGNACSNLPGFICLNSKNSKTFNLPYAPRIFVWLQWTDFSL